MKKKRFVYIDWDFTLADFDHGAGVDSLTAHLAADVVTFTHAEQLASDVDRVFRDVLRFMRTGLPTPIVQSLHKRLANTLGTFHHGLYWSREIWMLEIGLQRDIHLNANDISDAVDTYWEGVGDSARPYSGAREFFEHARVRTDGIVVVTSSDARLKPGDDKTFIYDPVFSREQKLSRMHSNPDAAILLDNYVTHVVVGDPHEKNEAAFWAEANEAVGWTNDDTVIIVGDSYAGDIVNGKSHVDDAYGILVTQDENADPARFPEANLIVPTLTDALEYI